MLSFTNYKRRSFSYTIGTCYDFGGLWFEQPTTSTPAQIFADSSCKVVVHVINITACEQNTALKMTYYPPSAYGSQDAEFQAFYNDGRKYFNFAIPSNCLNKTIVRFQPTVTKDDREIAVLTVTIQTNENPKKPKFSETPKTPIHNLCRWTTNLNSRSKSTAHCKMCALRRSRRKPMPSTPC